MPAPPPPPPPPPPADAPSWQWILGAFLSIGGTTIANFGINIQKYSHTKNTALPEYEQKSFFMQPVWVLGFVFLILGNLADVIALTFAPQSLLAPLGFVGLAVNPVFSVWLNGEKFTYWDLGGTILVVAGATLTTVFGSRQQEDYTLQDLLSFYGRPQFIIYICITAALVVTQYLMIKQTTKDILQNGITYVSDVKLKILRFNYASIGGVIGGQTILMGKSFAEMIKTTASGDNQMASPIPYLFLVVLGTCAFMQIHFTNTGLQYFDAMYVVPVFLVAFTMFSILGGAIYFNEMQQFTAIQWSMYIFGTIVTVVGVFVFSQRVTQQVSQNLSEFELIEEIDEKGNIISVRPVFGPLPASEAKDGEDKSAEVTWVGGAGDSAPAGSIATRPAISVNPLLASRGSATTPLAPLTSDPTNTTRLFTSIIKPTADLLQPAPSSAAADSSAAAAISKRKSFADHLQSLGRSSLRLFNSNILSASNFFPGNVPASASMAQSLARWSELGTLAPVQNATTSSTTSPTPATSGGGGGSGSGGGGGGGAGTVNSAAPVSHHQPQQSAAAGTQMVSPRLLAAHPRSANFGGAPNGDVKQTEVALASLDP
eukprot:gnl/Spiro4/24315_TR12078_c0_g1_i1.p1 gnl/Spiro4/24315_TR12078_c0_g1~~gnl/Spiro4/24315_TR12078_c0_g1_i1.p1  ORF type:complete len:599 (+),score=138.18 gnl/Spiro4/24315_TR12078_c0_g1_i1:90-1886(+)